MQGEGETFRLLQPGLMSIDELNEILSQRGVQMKSIESKTKYDLVELYERHIMPLSQRRFPNSSRGQLLSKKIVEEERRRTENEPQTSNFQYGFKDKPSVSSSKSQISHQSSRLKPPIDSASPPLKKICLSRRSSSDNDMDKIVINDRSKRNSESSSEETKREPSNRVDKRTSDKLSPVKSQSSTTKDSKEKGIDEPIPKRKKIAWP